MIPPVGSQPGAGPLRAAPSHARLESSRQHHGAARLPSRNEQQHERRAAESGAGGRCMGSAGRGHRQQSARKHNVLLGNIRRVDARCVSGHRVNSERESEADDVRSPPRTSHGGNRGISSSDSAVASARRALGFPRICAEAGNASRRHARGTPVTYVKASLSGGDVARSTRGGGAWQGNASDRMPSHTGPTGRGRHDDARRVASAIGGGFLRCDSSNGERTKCDNRNDRGNARAERRAAFANGRCSCSCAAASWGRHQCHNAAVEDARSLRV